MINFTNLKKVPYEILDLLLLDSKIKRLLWDESSSALKENKQALPDNETFIQEHYCNILPVEMGIENFNRNAFITIVPEIFHFNALDKSNVLSGSIFIIVEKEHLLLDNNKNRLFELLDRIVNALDGKKLSATINLDISGATYINYSNYRFGYKINFKVVDQENEKATI